MSGVEEQQMEPAYPEDAMLQDVMTQRQDIQNAFQEMRSQWHKLGSLRQELKEANDKIEVLIEALWKTAYSLQKCHHILKRRSTPNAAGDPNLQQRLISELDPRQKLAFQVLKIRRNAGLSQENKREIYRRLDQLIRKSRLKSRQDEEPEDTEANVGEAEGHGNDPEEDYSDLKFDDETLREILDTETVEHFISEAQTMQESLQRAYKDIRRIILNMQHLHAQVSNSHKEIESKFNIVNKGTDEIKKLVKLAEETLSDTTEQDTNVQKRNEECPWKLQGHVDDLMKGIQEDHFIMQKNKTCLEDFVLVIGDIEKEMEGTDSVIELSVTAGEEEAKEEAKAEEAKEETDDDEDNVDENPYDDKDDGCGPER